jgi:hypothetical protein
MTALGPDGLPRTVPPGADPYATDPLATDPFATGERGRFTDDELRREAFNGDRAPSSAAYAGDGQTAHERAEAASIGDLVSDVSRGLSTLLRQEVELAKAEAKESATKAGKGAGMLSGAAMAGWFTLLFLSLAIWEWLSGALDNRGWAAVIVMAVWAVVAAILAAMGRKKIKDIQGMSRTVETAKQVPDALKGNEEKL